MSIRSSLNHRRRSTTGYVNREPRTSPPPIYSDFYLSEMIAADGGQPSRQTASLAAYFFLPFLNDPRKIFRISRACVATPYALIPSRKQLEKKRKQLLRTKLSHYAKIYIGPRKT